MEQEHEKNGRPSIGKSGAGWTTINPSAGPRCWSGNSFTTLPRSRSWCTWRRRLVERHRFPFGRRPNDYGSSRWRRYDSTAGL